MRTDANPLPGRTSELARATLYFDPLSYAVGSIDVEQIITASDADAGVGVCKLPLADNRRYIRVK
jgi:hypothetical protein